MKLRLLFTLFLLLLVAGVTHAADIADATFARAAQLADTDLTQSRELYRVAALQYLAEAGTNAAARGPLLYNAGNAFFLAGDAGRAVVAYRRAEQVMPGSSLLRDNLAFVRKQAGNVEEKASESRLGMLFFWRWNAAALWLLLAGAWLLLWAGLFWRQWSGHGCPQMVLKFTLGVAVLLAVTLLWQQVQAAQRCRGVIVASQVEARKGPNYGYASAFTAPLDAGLEGEVIASEGDWLELRFDAGHQGWVRQSAVEIWQGTTPSPRLGVGNQLLWLSPDIS